MTVAPLIISVIKHETVDVELVVVGTITAVNVVDTPFIVLAIIFDTLIPLADQV
jgi:hypothetical protein